MHARVERIPLLREVALGASTASAVRWMTIARASDLTGLPRKFFYERTSARCGGIWPENEVCWIDGRKLVDLVAVYAVIDRRVSGPASLRGHRP